MNCGKYVLYSSISARYIGGPVKTLSIGTKEYTGI
jgi:hypothetical protein